MKTKNLIQLIVIVACFGASALVIYNNFFKKTELPPSLSGITAPVSAEPVLPNGKQFDLSVVEKSTYRFKLLDYPVLNYPTEVGVAPEEAIKSTAPKVPPAGQK